MQKALLKRSKSDDAAQALSGNQLAEKAGYEVLVVFVNHTQCYWLKFLKSGFRHCFSVIRDGNKWIVCDSLKGHMELFVIDGGPDFNLAEFYAKQGYVVLAGTNIQRKTDDRPRVEFLTCVTVVKRLLGLQSFWVWTPWQLFCLLISRPSHGGSWRCFSMNHEKEVSFRLDIQQK